MCGEDGRRWGASGGQRDGKWEEKMMSACGPPGGWMSGQKSPCPMLPMCPACAIPCSHPVWGLHPYLASHQSDANRQPSMVSPHTCSWPRMMTPWGLMACQEARFSPAARCSPSWYADHLPSRVVHATQTWCQALSFRLNGSWATFARNMSLALSGTAGRPQCPPSASQNKWCIPTAAASQILQTSGCAASPFQNPPWRAILLILLPPPQALAPLRALFRRVIL